MATALRPDVDLDGDLVPDHLSVGYRITGVPVIIDN
jgi:hypothetical protein